MPTAARDAVVRSLRYRAVDVADSERVASLVEPDRGPVAAYLALPPALFPAAVVALCRAGLPAGSRIALEKPFGEDLQSAIALNQFLAESVAPANEQAVYRVDHILGMPTAHNLLMLRRANPFLERVWNGEHMSRWRSSGRRPWRSKAGPATTTGRGAQGRAPEPYAPAPRPDRHGSTIRTRRARSP